jgi:hypothetical protein
MVMGSLVDAEEWEEDEDALVDGSIFETTSLPAEQGNEKMGMSRGKRTIIYCHLISLHFLSHSLPSRFSFCRDSVLS